MSPALRAPEGSFAALLGVGAYRPARIVTNDEICERIDSSDAWIQERSGIVERRFAADDEDVVTMGTAAADKALAHAGIAADQIDAVIVATISYFYQTPAAAALIADRIGATNASAFDLSAACAGFCHGVAVANDLVRGGTARHVLVIGAEKFSELIDPTDRSAAFIFGDGAGAVVIGPAAQPGIAPVVWGADGSQAALIAQDRPWNDLRDTPGGKFPSMIMEGQPVFRWAVFGMAPIAEQALTAAGITAADLGAFIPHQANLRIIESMAKRLNLPEQVTIARDIVYTGNTSAASIPLAMAQLLESGTARSGDLALLIGYGAGLSYAAQVVVLP